MNKYDLISREALQKEIQKIEKDPDYQHEGENWYNGLCMAEILIDNAPTVEPEEISKIKEITERALRSQDPINLYKACCINEIAELLGIEEDKQDIKEQDDKDQITIDDIIKEA